MLQPTHTLSPTEPDLFVHQRSCPTCGGASAFPAVRAEQPAEALDANALSQNWRGFFQQSCFFTYCRCAQCGTLFAPTYLSSSMLGKLYVSMDDNIHSGDETLSYLTQVAYAQVIANRTSKAGRYLEIGPDTGLFARALQKEVKLSTVYLAEPNRKSWDALTKEFAPGTAHIVPEIAELEGDVKDGSLDLAIGIHVLDHMLEPLKTVEWVAKKLAKGGVTAFVVHNERSLLARVLGQRWPAYCMQHPQLYNPKTLTELMRKAGLSAITVHSMPNFFPLGYLLSHGIYALTRIRVDCSWLSLPLRLKLGNIMVVAVRQ